MEQNTSEIIPLYWNKITKLDLTLKNKKWTEKILSNLWITKDILQQYNTSIEHLIKEANNYKQNLKNSFKKRSIIYKNNISKLIDNQECTSETDYHKNFFWLPPEEHIYSYTEIIQDSKWKILTIMLWIKIKSKK